MKKIMKIFKGFHYPFPLDFGGYLVKKVNPDDNYIANTSYTFDPNCKYEIGEDQSDVNKLFGFSLGYHHRNSVRIGWRYRDGNLEICYYAYQNGKRLPTKVIEKIELKENPVTVDIDLSFDRELDEISIIVQTDISCKCINYEYSFQNNKPVWSYGLGLYFGGNKTAPHTMKVTRNYIDASWGRK